VQVGKVRAQRGRGLCVTLVVSALLIWGVLGQVWRVQRNKVRGVERASVSAAEQRPGVNADLTLYEGPELEHALDDIQSLGMHWVRQRFPWHEIELSPGVWAWEPWDAIVKAVREREMGLVAVLDAAPEWAKRRETLPLPCDPPWDPQAYAEFASAFAARYGADIDVYQVWDEPNLSRSWGGGHVHPCGYAVLLEHAYAALHAADGNALVLGGGFAPTQAPGPTDLNELIYLRELYAVGGGAFFDALAAKPYGFWSGPDDRRVAPSVLNFSRLIALREVMRASGDKGKAVWAVEWGWNALPADWQGDPAPWGTDTPDVQGPRIVGAALRARQEWPWLGPMLWAEYQPDAPSTDPRWGFALRGPEGAPTSLYEALLSMRDLPGPDRGRVIWPSTRTGAWIGVLAVTIALWTVTWRWCRCGSQLCALGAWWAARAWWVHLAALGVVAVLYALAPTPEWMAVALAAGGAVLYAHPSWALLGAVLGIPFYYMGKRVGSLWVTPSETLLSLYLGVSVARWVWDSWRGRGMWHVRPRVRLGQFTLLDGAWAAWSVVGTAAMLSAPDVQWGLREWRLCVVGPALLYAVLRGSARAAPSAALSGRAIVRAWVASGVVLSIVGLVQWLADIRVPAGAVGRVTGVYYSPNHLALYLERVLPVALVVPLSSRQRGLWRWMPALFVGMTLYLTFSRGAWAFAVPLALTVMIIAWGRRLRWVVVAGAVTIVILAVLSVVGGRAASVRDLDAELRPLVWHSTLEMIADHPWFGVGLDGFRSVYPRYMRLEAWTEPLLYHPHNMWLDAAVRTGLPGAAVYLVLYAACARSAWARWRTARTLSRPTTDVLIALGCIGSLAAGLGHGMVDSGYFLADLAWCLALIAGLVERRDRV